MFQLNSISCLSSFRKKAVNIKCCYSTLDTRPSINYTHGSAWNRRKATNYFWPFIVTSITAAGLVFYFFEEKNKLEDRSNYYCFLC